MPYVKLHSLITTNKLYNFIKGQSLFISFTPLYLSHLISTRFRLVILLMLKSQTKFIQILLHQKIH